MAPFVEDAGIVYHSGLRGGMRRRHRCDHPVPGKWGQALYLGVPDGRFGVEAASLKLGLTGTIEWWVRPRRPSACGMTRAGITSCTATRRMRRGPRSTSAANPLTRLQLTAACGGAGRAIAVGTPAMRTWRSGIICWSPGTFAVARQYLWAAVSTARASAVLPRVFAGPPLPACSSATPPRFRAALAVHGWCGG